MIPQPGRTRATDTVRPWRELVGLVVWCALVSGLGEVALLTAKKVILHRPIHLGPHYVWMVPAASLILFGVAGLGLAVARRLRSSWSPRTDLTVLFSLAILAQLTLIQGLHGGAAVLLALGVGTFLARRLAGRRWFETLRRRTRRVLVALVALAAVGMPAAEHIREWRTLRDLPTAPSGAPDVLLIVLDTVGALHMRAHGYHRPTTPRLERRARRGVRFDVALATAPWTLPSHASLFTGLWPHETSVDWDRGLSDDPRTLAEALGDRGYATAGFVANRKVVSWETGLDRGFAHWEGYPVDPSEILRSSALVRRVTSQSLVRRAMGWYDELGRKDGSEVTREFLAWAKERESRPYFAFLNYFDAHAPYLPPPPHDTAFGARLPREHTRDEFAPDWTPADVEAERNAYDATLRYLDAELGRLFRSLEERGALEETLVIVTSDHGEEFYEHGVMRHGHSLYRKSVQVPLLVWLPGSPEPGGLRVPAPVSIRDVPATILDLVGGSDGGRGFPGRSLARFWDGEDRARPGRDTILAEVTRAPRNPPAYPVSAGDMHSVVLGGYRYIRNGDGSAELYDFARDTAEAEDLSGDPAHRATLAEMRAALEAALAR